jgi:hypothetical protein
MNLIRADSIFMLDKGLTKEFASPFALEKYEKEKRFYDNNAWKNQSGDEGQAGLMSRGMLWGARSMRQPPRKPRMRFVQRVKNRRYYVLELSRACGLFYYDLDKDEEIRLFHREVFSPRGFHVDDDFGIVTTAAEEDGSSHIVRLDPDGRQVKQLTSGDCVDENPFFHDGCIFYQSSGIARTQQGIAALFAPAEILSLNLNSGSVETIKSYPGHDCILPKVDGEGNLYYIKAPYRSGQVSVGTRFLDVILFPFRLCAAIIAFLNVFSIFFTKRPLKTSGGPDIREMDLTHRLLHNRVIDIQQTMRKEGKKVAAPRDWRLIRLRNGAEEELATNVVWYEVAKDGRVIHTDGFTIYDAERKTVYESDELVSCVAL